MKGFDGYLFLLPGGAGRHADDPSACAPAPRCRGWEGWLLGCRERPRPGGARGRRRVLVTPLGALGTPAGALAVALAAAGAREGCDYVLAAAVLIARDRRTVVLRLALPEPEPGVALAGARGGHASARHGVIQPGAIRAVGNEAGAMPAGER